VESEPGCGSRFQFTAQLGIAPAPPDAAATPSELRGVTVLVVDDNVNSSRVLADTLARWGALPVIATTHPEAILKIEHHAKNGTPFRVILWDAHLPESDASRLPDWTFAGPDSKPAWILLRSGGQRINSRCREFAAARRLTKPFRQAELLAAVMEALGLAQSAGQPAGARSTQLQRQSESAKLRILVAEDNAVNQALIRRLLEKWDHTVRIAGNGEEAVSAAEHEQFDLILMDVQMPKMDGIEATVRLRKSESVTGVRRRIYAMTAHAMPGDREECLKAGMDGYVSKPIRTPELQAVLNTVEADVSAALTQHAV
jgi:CheY-like chemotaxis protein